MAGLDNYLTTLKDNAGMAGGYQQGLRDRASLDTTLASLEQQRAQNERYTGETPSYLQKSRAGARTAELANVQPEADLAAGVPQANAQQNLMTAKQKGLEAQQAWERLPEEHKQKMLTAIKTKQMEFFNTIEQTLTQSNDVNGTIATIEQEYPDVTRDQSWAMAKQRVSRMNPEQALAEIRKMKASLASSAAYGSPEMQSKMVLEDQQQVGREKIANIQGQYGVQAAQTRATTAEAGRKPSTDEFLYSQIQAANPNASPAQLAQMFVDAKTLVTKETPSILSPTGTATTTTRKGSGGGATDIKSMVEASGAKYEPNKFEYRINPETGKVQKKPKGN